MMKSEIEQQSPSLKLSLSIFPTTTPPGKLTPPLQSHLSIPFQWEEVPGKPRTTTTTTTSADDATAATKPKVARCLDLPPRLLAINDPVKTINMPSPTTVLDGPYVVGRSLSSTFSFRKGGSVMGSKEPRGGGGVLNFGSWRWGDLKGNSNRDLVVEGNYDFLPIFHGHGMVGDEILHTKVKITRVKKKGKFTTISNKKSHLWASIYESLKQVVPWRHMRQRKFERD